MADEQPPVGRRERTRARTRRSPARAAAGFTLVELLVSLVILGFVMSLVSEAIFQVAKITRAADATTRGLSARWGAGWTASSLFANLLAPQQDNDNPVMRGTPTQVEGYTSMPLEGGDSGITRFALSLQAADSATPQTEMHALPAAEDREATRRSTLVAAFPGRAEFAYLDRNAQLQATWPPITQTGVDPEDLPRAVLVRDSSSRAILMWYTFPGEATRQRKPTSPFGTLPP